jgi:CBS domain-containing protein
MLTARDIVTRAVAEGADPKTVTVSQAMSLEPVTCRPDCPVEDAARTMQERQIRRLLVTEEHQRGVLGIVSLGDIAVRSHEEGLVGEATEGICQPAG